MGRPFDAFWEATVGGEPDTSEDVLVDLDELLRTKTNYQERVTLVLGQEERVCP